MRYYIKADLKVKLESSLLLPGSFDFQIGAILADETMGSLYDSLELAYRIDKEGENNLIMALSNGLQGR